MDNMVNQIQRAWQRFGYDPEPRNTDPTQPIYLLGKRFPPVQPSRPSSPRLSQSTRPTSLVQPAVPTATATDPIDLTASDSVVQVDASQIPTAQALSDETSGNWPQEFRDDFGSKPWITYRCDFPPIPRAVDDKDAGEGGVPEQPQSFLTSLRGLTEQSSTAGFTSDKGWGCMIRSGQSVLANALFALHLGRGTSSPSQSASSSRSPAVMHDQLLFRNADDESDWILVEWHRGERSQEERRLLSLFADDPRAPFSIHEFTKYGNAACGVRPGEWFGPSAAARCIQALTNAHPEVGLRVYITGDGGDVYEDSFMAIAKPEGENFHPTLILIATRLGTRHVTPVYHEALKAVIQMPTSVGIAGGRPKSSHYFIGLQSSRFFYHDPHSVQPKFPFKQDLDTYTAEDLETCYTRRLRALPITEMDPSMLLAFLITTEEDFKHWKVGVESVQGKSVVHVYDKEPVMVDSFGERSEALDEVEPFDTDDEDEDLRDEAKGDLESEGVDLKGVEVPLRRDEDEGDGVEVRPEEARPEEEGDGVEVRESDVDDGEDSRVQEVPEEEEEYEEPTLVGGVQGRIQADVVTQMEGKVKEVMEETDRLNSLKKYGGKERNKDPVVVKT